MEEMIPQLVQLQRLDSRMRILRDFLEQAPELEAGLAAERQAAEDEISDQRAALEGAKQSLRKKESELASAEDRLGQIQAKLNQVKTNKEYDAALAEIAKQKAVIDDVESEILMLYDEVEGSEAARSELEATWQARADEFDDKASNLKGKIGGAESESAEKIDERAQLTESMAAEVLSQYEQLLDRVSPVVVNADQEVCLGCHTRIPAQRYNEVLKGETIINCTKCYRLLVNPGLDLSVENEDLLDAP